MESVMKLRPSPRSAACEDGISPKAVPREKLAGLGTPMITQGVIFCSTIPTEEINAICEDYNDLPYDTDDDLFELPFPHFSPTKNFSVLLQRKIYTYNCISACIAYCGHVRGYTDYGLAANDEYVNALCKALAEQLTHALSKEYNIPEDVQRTFAGNAIRKFTDTSITDTILKNARAVMRKLSPGERVMGPLKMFMKYGESICILETIAACAYRYLIDKEADLMREAGYSTPSEFFKKANPDLPKELYADIDAKFEALNALNGIEYVLAKAV